MQYEKQSVFTKAKLALVAFVEFVMNFLILFWNTLFSDTPSDKIVMKKEKRWKGLWGGGSSGRRLGGGGGGNGIGRRVGGVVGPNDPGRGVSNLQMGGG